MKNQNQNTPVSPKLHICQGCKETGSVGAKWLLYAEGETQPKLVHRPCGEALIKNAPEGVKARLVPTRQLRDEWRVKRMAKDFWGAAFSNAKPLNSKPVSKPVLMTVTTPLPVMIDPTTTESVKAA